MRDFGERVIFKNGGNTPILFDVNGGKLPAVVTPSVQNVTHFKTISAAPITITNFLNGAAYQSINILGEGQTTVANNANIKTNTGANKLLAANKVYRFTNFSGVWYEDA